MPLTLDTQEFPVEHETPACPSALSTTSCYAVRTAIYCYRPAAAQGYGSDGRMPFVDAGAWQRVRGSLLGLLLAPLR